MRFRIWRARHNARVVSRQLAGRHAGAEVTAKLDDCIVGVYVKGKRIK